MRALTIIDLVLGIYCWILVVVAVSQLLKGFNVVPVANNRLFSAVDGFLDTITSPPLRLVRKGLPDYGPVDFSPIVLLIILMTIRYALALYLWPAQMPG